MAGFLERSSRLSQRAMVILKQLRLVKHLYSLSMHDHAQSALATSLEGLEGMLMRVKASGSREQKDR